MGQKTSIEWVKSADGSQGHSANPIRFRLKSSGKVVHFCVKHSSGCANCYSETLGHRWGSPEFIARNLDKVEPFLDEAVLQSILRRRKPTTWFLADMTDWMAEWVPDEFIDKIFATAALCPHHTFQLLTKRAERLPAYMAMVEEEKDMQRWINAAVDLTKSPCVGHLADELEYPLKNLWLGVSCENQATADERIPHLLRTRAAVRFVSAEPLLGPMDLSKYLQTGRCKSVGPETYQGRCGLPEGHDGNHTLLIPTGYPWLHGGLEWLIVGGESGHGARPMHPRWAADLRDQCQAAAAPFFFKQWGQWVDLRQSPDCNTRRDGGHNPGFCPIGLDGRPVPNSADRNRGEVTVYSFGKKLTGRLLDGREWNEMPAVEAAR